MNTMSLYQSSLKVAPNNIYMYTPPNKHLLVKTGGFGVVVTIILAGGFVVGGKGGFVVGRAVGIVTGAGGFVVTGGG